jgi:hypothetical protein
MGERCNRTAEVRGSNPLSSTSRHFATGQIFEAPERLDISEAWRDQSAVAISRSHAGLGGLPGRESLTGIYRFRGWRSPRVRAEPNLGGKSWGQTGNWSEHPGATRPVSRPTVVLRTAPALKCERPPLLGPYDRKADKTFETSPQGRRPSAAAVTSLRARRAVRESSG